MFDLFDELPSPDTVLHLCRDFCDSLSAPRTVVAREDEADDDCSALDSLMALTGLDDVKQMVTRELSFHRIMAERSRRGHQSPRRLPHLLLTGNPGVGKTTVARLIGRIYHDAGILTSDRFVETSRAGLVGRYVGDTEANTSAKIREAAGGVLFIDEIYALADGGGDSRHDFGTKAIDTLMPVLSDPAAPVMVVGAGYPHRMRDFLASNPGLSSRFPNVVNCPDFSAEQLEQIALDHLARYDFSLTDEAAHALHALIVRGRRVPDCGNARMVLNILDNYAIPNLCARLDSGDASALSEDVLGRVEAHDLPDFDRLFPLAVSRNPVGY